MNIDGVILGNNIRRYRSRALMRQEDLAEKCDCSNSYIGQIENGRAYPSLRLAVKIANALSVTVDQLLRDSVDNTELIFFFCAILRYLFYK